MGHFYFSVAFAEGAGDESLCLAHLDEAEFADDVLCGADDDGVVLVVVEGQVADLAVAVQQLAGLVGQCFLGLHLNNNSL